MKVSVVLAGLVWPALAFGQQLYTNADLVKFNVPGAYTNDDLKRLPPLVVQKTSAFALPPFETPGPSRDTIADYRNAYRSLNLSRDALAFELDYELRRVDFSRSAFAGDPQGFEPRLGYGAKVKGLILELEKRIDLLDEAIDTLVGNARREGVLIDAR